jgi:CRISPR-associated protein Cmr5
MKSRIENYIPSALKEAEQLKTEGYIPKEFKGYISSFGAAAIQSGLIPALAFFSNDGESRGRSKILEAIRNILNIPVNKSLLQYVVEYCNEQDISKEILKDKIMDAATALKLAIRTYQLK